MLSLGLGFVLCFVLFWSCRRTTTRVCLLCFGCPPVAALLTDLPIPLCVLCLPPLPVLVRLDEQLYPGACSGIFFDEAPFLLNEPEILATFEAHNTIAHATFDSDTEVSCRGVAPIGGRSLVARGGFTGAATQPPQGAKAVGETRDTGD